jgi:NADPH2:quinone reductase
MMAAAPGRLIGREAKGMIVTTGHGTVNNLKVGDRVVWLAICSYAEYTAVSRSMVYPVPSDVKPGIAAAAFLQALFAMSLIHEFVQVKEEVRVLAHASVVGVGLWAQKLLALQVQHKN